MVVALLVSGVSPYGRLTWWLDIFPILIALTILIFTHRRFTLIYFLYILLAIHTIITCVGRHYTYARALLGFTLEHASHLPRNNYDRIGHFEQGAMPAISLHELLLRTSNLGLSTLLYVLIIGMCLWFSAFYELFKWWAAVALGQGLENFLGTQDDPWETQWNMFTASIGTTVSLVVFSKWHDSCLPSLEKNSLPVDALVSFFYSQWKISLSLMLQGLQPGVINC
jgi:putative membrane protein